MTSEERLRTEHRGRPSQLTLDGTVEPTFRLGPNQQAVLAELERLGTLTKDEAGALIHELRGKHGRDERCAYCAIDGRPVLDSLIPHGLAERGAEGAVQLPRPSSYGEMPKGF